MLPDRLRSLFASVVKMPEAKVKLNAHVMDELGADSLQFLDYVHTVEREFGVKLKGSESEQFSTIQRAAVFLEKRLAAQAAAAPEPPTAPAAPASAPVAAAPLEVSASVDSATTFAIPTGMVMEADGLLHAPLVVGLPFTGRNNMAETPLLKFIGDLRWTHTSIFSGVPSRLLSDDTGERLYATFFYIETSFSEEKPMASYGENDEFRVISTIKCFGGSVMDGYHWLAPVGMKALPADPFAAGLPYVRATNIFVKMLQGAQWLKKSKPAQAGVDLIPQLDAVPDSADLCKQADAEDRFGPPPAGWVPLSDGPVVVEYDIQPDRDLNGAGMLYFANYPQILDIMERKVMQDLLSIRLPEGLVDMRTLVKRQSAYLSNASQSDRLKISMTIYAENPFVPAPGRPAVAADRPLHLWLNFVMRRCSDDRKMLVSTARKTFTGATWGGSGLLPALQERIDQMPG
ncbi:MAG: LnmK family bifunctional acyltransferase/decarboxylase [Prosthecobacter sp.]